MYKDYSEEKVPSDMNKIKMMPKVKWLTFQSYADAQLRYDYINDHKDPSVKDQKQLKDKVAKVILKNG